MWPKVEHQVDAHPLLHKIKLFYNLKNYFYSYVITYIKILSTKTQKTILKKSYQTPPEFLGNALFF
jgi:hypothetical protein